jgi:RNA polymerase sigma-70 factor (ECF subfamily)
MTDLTDHELVARCQAGSDDAFAELVGRYRTRVFGLILRTVGDRSRAEDLAQDVFLRVHRGLPYFRGQARLSTWIYRIVVNLCLQEKQRPVRIEVPADEAGDDEHAPRQLATTDRAFAGIELRDQLSKALAQLPPNYRLLIAAHYLEGVQYEDLAEALDLPLGTIKTQLHRARQQLRKLLETQGSGSGGGRGPRTGE